MIDTSKLNQNSVQKVMPIKLPAIKPGTVLINAGKLFTGDTEVRGLFCPA